MLKSLVASQKIIKNELSVVLYTFDTLMYIIYRFVEAVNQ